MVEDEYITVTAIKEITIIFKAQCSLTNTAAMPMPDPMHMLVTNIRLFICFAMFRPVAIWRAPAVQGEKRSDF